MAKNELITILETLGEFMEGIENFFLNITPGYYYFIMGLSFILIVGLIFYYIVKTKDWVLTQ